MTFFFPLAVYRLKNSNYLTYRKFVIVVKSQLIIFALGVWSLYTLIVSSILTKSNISFSVLISLAIFCQLHYDFAILWFWGTHIDFSTAYTTSSQIYFCRASKQSTFNAHRKFHNSSRTPLQCLCLLVAAFTEILRLLEKNSSKKSLFSSRIE